MKKKTLILWLSGGVIITVVMLMLQTSGGGGTTDRPDEAQLNSGDERDDTNLSETISLMSGAANNSSQAFPQHSIEAQPVPLDSPREEASSSISATRIVSNDDKHKLGLPGSEAVALLQELYYELDDQKASWREKLDLLKKMEMAVRSGLVNPDEYDEALRFVASGNYWIGDVEHALELGRELMENASDEYIAVSSAQLVGMIEGFDHNNPEASMEAYQRAVELIEASDNWNTHQMQARYAESLGKIAYAYERTGDYERAVEYRKRVLSLHSIGARAWLTGLRQMHEERLAQDLAQLGRLDEASAWYDRLLRNYPNLGRDDGTIVNIIWDQINALGLPEHSQERLDRLWALFNDESMSKYHQIVGIGNVIAQIYIKRDGWLGGSGSEDVERAWGALWHKCDVLLNNQSAMADSFAREHVLSNATTALFNLGLAQSRNGDRAGAIDTLREFLNRFPDHDLVIPAQRYLNLYLSIPVQ